MSPERSRFSIVPAIVLLGLALIAVFAEHALPRGGSVGAVRFHLDALRQADLNALERSADESVFLTYMTQASEPAFEQLRELYHERIPRIAMPTWRDYRDQARAGAGREYEELRRKVLPLGRVRYQQLGPEERRGIIESGSFNQYIFEAGVKLLPVEERDRVPDARAFYHREDQRRYQSEQAWRHVPEEVRADLGTRQALVDQDTPEKFAYFDKVAAPSLSLEEQQTLVTVPRADVDSLARFVAGHGARLLTKRLLESPPQLPGAASVDCTSPAFERGSLLHGPWARCSSAGGEPVFLLRRLAFEWRVTAVDGLNLGVVRR